MKRGEQKTIPNALPKVHDRYYHFIGSSGLILSLLFLTGCRKRLSEWSVFFPDLSSFSSPRPADLNQDGIQGLVIGVGKKEFMAIDTGVIAIDGLDGSVIWFSPTKDQKNNSGAHRWI